MPRPQGPPDWALPTLDSLDFEELGRVHPVVLVETDLPYARHSTPGTLEGFETADFTPSAPWVASEVDLDPQENSPVWTGLVSAQGDPVVGVALRDGSALVLSHTSGSERIVARTVQPAGVETLGFALTERRISLFVRRNGTWELLLNVTSVDGAPDFRTPDVISQHGLGWGALSGPVRVAEVRAGHFGRVGLRDPRLVQGADGSPWHQDGRYWLTWTCAGPGFFEQAHWGGFSVDPSRPTELRQEASLFTTRNGLLLGDHAGQIVRGKDEWLVVNSSWGDFGDNGVHVRCTRTEADILRGVHLLRTDPLNLPTTHGSWDPGLTRIQDVWHLSVVLSPDQDPFDFHPALATTTGEDPFSDLTLVAQRPELHQTEGPVLVRVQGTWRLLANEGDARLHRIYDLALREVGTLSARYTTNIPHAQLLKVGPRVLMFSFDATSSVYGVSGYGGHGDTVVFAAS